MWLIHNEHSPVLPMVNIWSFSSQIETQKNLKISTY